MKKIVIAFYTALLIVASPYVVQAENSKSTIVFVDNYRDIVIAKSDSWGGQYTVLKCSGRVSSGDVIFGDIDTSLSDNFYNITRDSVFSGQRDRSGLSRSETIDWLMNNISGLSKNEAESMLN